MPLTIPPSTYANQINFSSTGGLISTNTAAAIDEVYTKSAKLVNDNVFSGKQSISNTTAATSPTTGSLINAGGFGNAGDMQIGGNIVSANDKSLTLNTTGTGSLINFVRSSTTVSIRMVSARFTVSDGTSNAAGLQVITGAAPAVIVGQDNVANNGTLRAANISGVTDTAAANLILATGTGTGSAVPPYIDFQVANLIASGTTQQSLSSKMRLSSNGNLLIGTTSDNAVDKLQVNGSIRASQYKLSALNTPPASANDTGTVGEIRWANGFVYLCVATNTWQRAALSTWLM
ncbi:hypothetical protein [uncultured Nostoc sp.]|uniref:hypothetical protein n=1 Tax=uncultured Nostoc sp. TaxID=340711 RepID=UPI0035CBC5DD